MNDSSSHVPLHVDPGALAVVDGDGESAGALCGEDPGVASPRRTGADGHAAPVEIRLYMKGGATV